MFPHTHLTVFGVPSSAGAWITGQEKAPATLRAQGIVARLEARGLPLHDLGDAPVAAYAPDPDNPTMRNIDRVREVALDAAAGLEVGLDDDTVPLVLGGGCTISIGVLAALVRRHDRLGLVYVDGDLDFNTPETSPSGTLDGMGLAHIVGRGAPQLAHIASRVPLVPEERVIAFGYNPEAGWIDASELEALECSSIAPFPASRVKANPCTAAEVALDRLRETADAFLLHVDVDVMDVAEFPATDAQHDFGLAAADLVAALKVFVASSQCVGVVVTEYNPDLDPSGASARKLIGIVEDVLVTTSA